MYSERYFQTILPAYNQSWYILKNEQWLMVLALPFMVLYNGKRGGKCKYFFYLFYPIHIYVLYILGALINN
ncbi:TraX family protein [Vallitalea sp.]|uniref:TraX family protein n=1 Tax=Vallitalea sp. TaxID=1882829 RepID=UPI0025E21142|nr:TraX family protein [Vallitalea sp.]MCT4687170.1 conjugal transfer protein TraX [Vallitalea sp.]